jgi:hypothetical protein
MDALKAQAQQLKDFMSDGQLTQDELNKLPADSPFRKLTTLMADGKITTDELSRSVAASAASVAASASVGHFGKGDKHDDDASPAPSATTGG